MDQCCVKTFYLKFLFRQFKLFYLIIIIITFYFLAPGYESVFGEFGYQISVISQSLFLTMSNRLRLFSFKP